MLSKFKVYPLLYCTTQELAFSRVRVMTSGHGGDYEKTVTMPCVGYAVDDGENRILVDTGPPEKEILEQIDGRPWHDYTSVTEALKKATGWNPDDVNIVVNTHLHFDHCSGNIYFIEAEHYIQREEVRYAAAPTGLDKPWPIIKEPRFWDLELRLVIGDYQLTDGITLLHLPGHSPGHQGVLLDGGKRALIAGDQIETYANWEHKTLGNFAYDKENWFFSLKKIEKLGIDIVFPGHDMGVFKQKKYEVIKKKLYKNNE